jgi:hypothetical protein
MMNILKLVFREFFGMFIDDGALAPLALLLTAVAGLLVKFAYVDALLAAALLLLGCLLILAESVASAARRKFRGK